MLDAPGRYFQPVNATRVPDVKASPLVFSKTPDDVARQSLCHRVKREAWLFRCRVIAPHCATPFRSQPESPTAINPNALHHFVRQSHLSTKIFQPALAITQRPAIMHGEPDVARAVFRDPVRPVVGRDTVHLAEALP